MKITAVETEILEEPVKHQYVWRKGLPGSETHSISTKVMIRSNESPSPLGAPDRDDGHG